MSNRRYDELSINFEANKSTIEKIIDSWREEETVLTVQPLLVGSIPPRLAMACRQMCRVLDAGYSTSAFDPCYAVTE